MSTALTIMAAERVSIWNPRSWRIRNIFQPKTLPREKQLPPFFQTVLANHNAPAIKQLNDLVKESRAVAHAEIAVLSKPTPKFTKDRIFEFVEAANRPVSVAEIAAALPDVARSGVSSRVSEMRHAGSLWLHFRHDDKGNYTLAYTVPETK